MTSPCFGIDLGTTASAIALVQNGQPKVLSVDGQSLVPSVIVCPPDGEMLVGQAALNALPLHPTRGVQSSKRRMGTHHTWTLGGQTLSAVDVAEQILRRLCEGAAKACGIEPRRVVITVPAWFTQTQRGDTRKAGEQAGLDVVAILNEPTAAALVHAQGGTGRRKVLVYDLGGGTFDASVVDQDGSVLEVVASHGDSLLGGDDIDAALLSRVLSRLADEQPGLHSAVVDSQAARVRLRLAVEEAKVALSSSLTTTLRLPYLGEGTGSDAHLELELTRGELEEVSEPLLRRTLASVHQVLGDAGVRPADLDELVLVGGATLQPLVWSILHAELGLEGSHAISPRRAVVLGAALHAAILDGATDLGVLVDVAPYSLSAGALMFLGGVESYGCKVITPRNAPLPAVHSELFYTTHPMQRSLVMLIFQGASRSPERNVFLGAVECRDLPVKASDTEQRPIRVTFHHDRDGMVRVDVVDVLSGQVGTGQVAADGADQGGRRDREFADLRSQGIALAPPAPTELAQPVRSELVPEVWEASEEADEGDELTRTFEGVLDPALELNALVGAEAGGLRSLAERGRAALASGDADTAERLFDELTDALLEHGVFL